MLITNVEITKPHINLTLEELKSWLEQVLVVFPHEYAVMPPKGIKYVSTERLDEWADEHLDHEAKRRRVMRGGGS